MANVEAVLATADGVFEASLGRLCELLRLPSVGTDPAYHADCQRAAEWVRTELDRTGFTTSLRPTTGRPVVIGTYAPEALPSHAPHVLFYGHYDVQPADPLDLWESPPFEPQIRKGKDGKARIFARGASDDKGQFMTFLEATRAWLSVNGSLPFRLTMLIEGDEEGDSTHLDRFLAKNRKELKSDIAFICDTDAWDEKTPAITASLRGCICEEVMITGPRVDLHSGDYGGAAINPIRVLSRILADMHGPKGRVMIKGFYDNVKPLPDEVRKEWAKLKFSARRFLGDVGLSTPAGEEAYSVLEQMWGRPTAEINGIYGGYRGVGVKTVLPSSATAKLSFRLVEGQEPRHIRREFRRFVRARLPADCKAYFKSDGGDSTGISVSRDSRWVSAARAALKSEWGRAPVLIGTGGSIPVVESFRRHLGIDSLLVGFGQEDDGQHSPNEKYDLECYRKGIRSWIRIIGEVAKQ
jgi:acetylornithine deacetylase/succinyl-diaminopimelate desuccinylase-like protein